MINAPLGGAKGGSVPFGYLKTNMELDLSCNQDSSIAAATVATAVMHNCTRALRRSYGCAMVEEVVVVKSFLIGT